MISKGQPFLAHLHFFVASFDFKLFFLNPKINNGLGLTEVSRPLSIVNEVQFTIDVVADETGLVTPGFSEFLGPLDLQSRGLDEAAERKTCRGMSIFIKISYFMQKPGQLRGPKLICIRHEPQSFG